MNRSGRDNTASANGSGDWPKNRRSIDYCGRRLKSSTAVFGGSSARELSTAPKFPVALACRFVGRREGWNSFPHPMPLTWARMTSRTSSRCHCEKKSQRYARRDFSAAQRESGNEI
jgi:hypothetical protein